MDGRYEDRIRRVLQHIHDHPDGDLSLDALAEVAAMSRFHWHRVFLGMTGETLAQAVRRMRAHRAAFWLVSTDWPLERIAVRAGYAGQRTFSRSFRELYGVTPLAYRRAGRIDTVPLLSRQGDHDMHPVAIRSLPPLRLAALPHRGPYIGIGAAFEQLSAIFSSRGFWPQSQGMVGVYYDPPGAVPEAELRSHAGITVADGFDMPADLEEVGLEGGRHAVLTFTGPYDRLHLAYDYLYGDWLPASGQETADRPPFERYLNSPAEVAPGELVTEICAPLA